MTEHKFEVGDIVLACSKERREVTHEIIAIIEGSDTINGPWICGFGDQNVCDVYIVRTIKSLCGHEGKIAVISFDCEYLYERINQTEKTKGEWNTTCKCGAPAFVSLFSVTCSRGCQ